MSNKQELIDKLFRKSARVAMYPHVRDVALGNDGGFVDTLTDTRLDDPLRLDDEELKRKIVLVNFFTINSENHTNRMAKIAAVAKHLGDHLGTNIFINSVTSEPDRDTPRKLAAFAKNLGAHKGWTFIRATDKAHQQIGARMNRVRGYTSGREVFYGMPRGFWGTFPVENSPQEVANRLIESIPGPKPTMRRAGPARPGKRKNPWSAREI